MLRFKAFLLAIAVTLMPAATALAQPDMGTAVVTPADPTVDAPGWVRVAYDAMQRHDYRMLAAVLLVGFVAVARKYGARVPGKVGAFVASDRGGAVLSLGLALIGGVIHALLAGQPLGLAMLGTAMYVSFLASGGYALVKKTGVLEWLRAGTVRMLPALVVAGVLGAGGCAWLQAHPTVAAALKCTESLVLAALEDVASAFASGSVNWAAIGHAEEVHGLDAVICAAQRLASPPPGAAVDVKRAKAARAYLSARGLR